MSSRTQVSVDFFSVSALISALSASRFFERAGAVAYSGRVERSAAPSDAANVIGGEGESAFYLNSPHLC